MLYINCIRKVFIPLKLFFSWIVFLCCLFTWKLSISREILRITPKTFLYILPGNILGGGLVFIYLMKKVFSQ